MGEAWRSEGERGLAIHVSHAGVTFYRGEKNVAYKQRDWSGTVSLWLKFDVEQAPLRVMLILQLTTRSWNDGAFFVDFNKMETHVIFVWVPSPT